MRDYGKVHSSFWSSSTIRNMSEDGRLLALYLLTCPHNTIAGVFRLPDGYACEDLQWSNERVSRGFGELLENGFANRCGTTKWVWIYKHLEWNPPENPNQRKSVNKVALQVPDDCSWKQEFRVNVAPETHNRCETLEQPFLNQEQEQEQEQNIEPCPVSPSKPAKRGCVIPFDALPDEYVIAGEKIRPELGTPEVMALGAQFIDYHRNKGTIGKDWMAGWRNWLRNDLKFNPPKLNGSHSASEAPTALHGRKMQIMTGPPQ